MSVKNMGRRDFLKTSLAGVPVLALDWDSFPRGMSIDSEDSDLLSHRCRKRSFEGGFEVLASNRQVVSFTCF
jgi:hypothetical protein